MYWKIDWILPFEGFQETVIITCMSITNMQYNRITLGWPVFKLVIAASLSFVHIKCKYLHISLQKANLNDFSNLRRHDYVVD